MAAGGPKSAQFACQYADGLITSVKNPADTVEKVIAPYRQSATEAGKEHLVLATRWTVLAGTDDEAWTALSSMRGLRAPGRLEATDPAELRIRADEMDRAEVLGSYTVVPDAAGLSRPTGRSSPTSAPTSSPSRSCPPSRWPPSRSSARRSCPRCGHWPADQEVLGNQLIRKSSEKGVRVSGEFAAGEFAAVDAIVSRYAGRGGAPGIAYGIVRDGELVHAGGTGERRLGGAVPTAGPSSGSRR